MPIYSIALTPADDPTNYLTCWHEEYDPRADGPMPEGTTHYVANGTAYRAFWPTLDAARAAVERSGLPAERLVIFADDEPVG